MDDALPGSNPFATRFTRPGQMPFFFPPEQDGSALVERLRGQGWWGQIVGPHGSGKSTLLATLVPLLQAAGRNVLRVELHDGQRRLPAEILRRSRFTCDTQLLIDGYEQLSRWQRLSVQRRCRLAGCGLLVTSHVSVGLAKLFCTRSDLATARELVSFLLSRQPALISPADIERSFHAHRGNLREMLFDLYDLFERRR